jgi:hypothetical protein
MARIIRCSSQTEKRRACRQTFRVNRRDSRSRVPRRECRFKLPNPVRFPCKNPVHPFIGLSVTLTPRFRTRPLQLECPADPPPGAVTSGFARTRKTELEAP